MLRENAHQKELNQHKPKKASAKNSKKFNGQRFEKNARAVVGVTGRVAKNAGRSSLEATKTNRGSKLALYGFAMIACTVASMVLLTKGEMTIWLDLFMGNIGAYLIYSPIMYMAEEDKATKKKKQKKKEVKTEQPTMTQAQQDELNYLRFMAMQGK